LIGVWVQVLKIPNKILFPLIFLFCLIGAYSINNMVFDLYVMLFFGVVGYMMRKFGYEPAPLILAYVLGPQLEQALRQSLLISKGSFWIFVSRPISGVAITCAFLLLLSNLVPSLRKGRKKIEEFQED